MTQTGTEPRSRARRRLVWVVVAAALVLVVAVVATRDRGVDPLEPTAWDNRAELDEVLRETATVAGISVVDEPVAEHALQCERNDGRTGASYFLHTLTAPGPVAAVDTVLDAVAEHWTSLGYGVDASRLGRVTALTPDGAVLDASGSQFGVRLDGETLCALSSGAPDE